MEFTLLPDMELFVMLELNTVLFDRVVLVVDELMMLFPTAL